MPGATLFCLLFSQSMFGRMLLVPFQIQFHELGHALLAWLSARAALPLPFGFTFFREEQSVFTGCCMTFLLVVLLHRALSERRPFGAIVALVLLLAFIVLAIACSAERSRMLILAAGIAGELVLSTLAIVGFYFQLPDRLRWDFFRFLLLGPAVGSWLAAVTLWSRIAHGLQSLPTGSMLGTPGDGSGDLERLMYEYDFSAAELTTLYCRLAWLTGTLLLVTYGVFALRAARTLWPSHPLLARMWP